MVRLCSHTAPRDLRRTLRVFGKVSVRLYSKYVTRVLMSRIQFCICRQVVKCARGRARTHRVRMARQNGVPYVRVIHHAALPARARVRELCNRRQSLVTQGPKGRRHLTQGLNSVVRNQTLRYIQKARKFSANCNESYL